VSTDSPTPGDPSAVDAARTSEASPPASPRSEITSGSNLAANEGDISIAQKRKWRHAARFRKQRTLAFIALIGVTAGIWAILIFPGTQTLRGPAAFGLFFDTKILLNGVGIDISHYGDGNADIYFYAVSPSANRVPSGNLGYIGLSIPGRFRTNCPTGVACYYTGQQISTQIVFPLFFNNGAFVSYNASIHDPNFAFAVNANAAIVQLPYITQDIGTSTTTTVYLNYGVPNVQSYYWSTPPWSTEQNFGFWIQYLNPTPQNLSGAEITGTNQVRQAQDDRATFISGVLLGVFGAAIIAVMQEGLHILDDERRRKKTNSAESGA
jgi:hypothetical protein